MKVVYYPQALKNLSQFGIDISLADDRSEKVFAFLQQHFPQALLPRWETVGPLGVSDLALAHHPRYIQRLLAEPQEAVSECYELTVVPGRYQSSQQRQGFELLVQQTFIAAQVTYFAMQAALEHGQIFCLGGGMHHAMSDLGRGFCLVNDIVIGIRKLQQAGAIKTAWVIDVDAHKGDGTAELTCNDPSIRTLSIHMAHGWPLDNQDLADRCFLPSDLDIPVAPEQAGVYLELLAQGLAQMRMRYGTPDFVVIVDGADPYEHDALASSRFIQLSKQQLLARDLLLYDFFQLLPTVYLMAGGYGAEAWEIYAQFLREIQVNFVGQ